MFPQLRLEFLIARKCKFRDAIEYSQSDSMANDARRVFRRAILRRWMRFGSIFPGKTREQRDRRRKFSRVIKHYRTSRARLIKSAASTPTAAHREERNHYEGKRICHRALFPRGETNGTWKTKKMAGKRDHGGCRVAYNREDESGRAEKRGKLVEKIVSWSKRRRNGIRRGISYTKRQS